MNDQLALMSDPSPDDEVSWELDERTRHVGRQGLAAARQALDHAASARLAA